MIGFTLLLTLTPTSPRISLQILPLQMQQNPSTGTILLNPSLPLQSQKDQNIASNVSIIENFQNIANRTLRSIPTIEDLQKLSDEEVHNTPTQIIEAASKIGKIASMLALDSSLKPIGIGFYEDCAKTENFPNSVRAVCYFNLKKLDLDHFKKLEPWIPKEIQRISEILN